MKFNSLNTAYEIKSFIATMSAEDKALPLRQCNTGFDLYKESGFKEYRRMTTGEFLEYAASLYRIPRPVKRLVDAVTYVMASPESRATEVIPTHESQGRQEPHMLPMNAEAPIFEQAANVIETLIERMTTVNDKCKKYAKRLEQSYVQGLTDDQIAEAESCHRENIRLYRTKFQADLMNGIVPKELTKELAISDSFISSVEATISSIVNQSVENSREHLGNLTEEKTKFILGMYGLELAKIGGVKFVLSKKDSTELIRLADEIRMQLKKEFDYVPLSTLTGGQGSSEAAFIKEYLTSMPEAYEFSEDGSAVRMIGAGLQKTTRQARIIYEAGTALSIEEISSRYEDLYGEEMGKLRTNELGLMGFSPMTKSRSWRFGTRPVKAQQIIREIFTPIHPIGTLNTVVKAIRKEGYDYPLSTIRSYISEIATSENKQPDLFCLKGYCHLYPTYSWRKYRKAIA